MGLLGGAARRRVGNEPSEENAPVELVLARVGGARIWEKDRLWPGRPWVVGNGTAAEGAVTATDGTEYGIFRQKKAKDASVVAQRASWGGFLVNFCNAPLHTFQSNPLILFVWSLRSDQDSNSRSIQISLSSAHCFLLYVSPLNHRSIQFHSTHAISLSLVCVLIE